RLSGSVGAAPAARSAAAAPAAEATNSEVSLPDAGVDGHARLRDSVPRAGPEGGHDPSDEGRDQRRVVLETGGRRWRRRASTPGWTSSGPNGVTGCKQT